MSDEEKSSSLVTSAISNLHGQYNFQSIAIVLVIMKANHEQTGWEESLLTCIAFVGAIHGQLLFGYIGDWLGRQRGLFLTNLFCVLGALGSSIFSWGDSTRIYLVIAVCRFFLGMGVGGTYPLSAVNAAEHSATTSLLDRRKRVSWSFFWQVPGSTLPFVVAYGVDKIFPENYDLQFRIVLGLGALPALIAMIYSLKVLDSKEFSSVKESTGIGIFYSLKRRDYWTKLIGTGGGWFCYDIVHYGPYLLAPVIIRQMFGRDGQEEESIDTISWQTALANLMGIPGVLICIALFKPLGIKHQQFYGFLLIASTFFAIGSLYKTASNTTLFVLFCIMTFAINSGPSVTTFVLPSETFPPEVRSTFNGLSAAMGKVGATLATFSDYFLFHDYGVEFNFFIFGLVALLGAIITWVFVEDIDARYRLSTATRTLSAEQKAIKQTAIKYTEFI